MYLYEALSIAVCILGGVLKKIVIIGPESTGKSTLSEQLARHYETMSCPEYAREYLLANGMNYSYDDLLTIARNRAILELNIGSLPQTRFYNFGIKGEF